MYVSIFIVSVITHNYHVILLLSEKKSNIKHKYQEIKVKWDGKESHPLKIQPSGNTYQDGPQLPPEHLHKLCLQLPSCLYGPQSDSVLQSRAHNRFVLFSILNIVFITLSYVFYICMCMYVYVHVFVYIKHIYSVLLCVDVCWGEWAKCIYFKLLNP